VLINCRVDVQFESGRAVEPRFSLYRRHREAYMGFFTLDRRCNEDCEFAPFLYLSGSFSFASSAHLGGLRHRRREAVLFDAFMHALSASYLLNFFHYGEAEEECWREKRVRADKT